MPVTASPMLETPLWTFALAVYGRDGVADECLALQERWQLDVNLLLFAACVGAVEGVRLAGEDIAAASAAVAGWQGDIVHPLRQARRALKPASADAGNPLHEPSSALRAQVKLAELEAEKLELAMLWQWARRQLAGRPGIERGQALAANLSAVLDFYGAAAGELAMAVPRLLDAAMAAA